MSSDTQIIGGVPDPGGLVNPVEVAVPPVPFLVSLAKNITHVSGMMFGSNITRYIILLFAMFCFWQPAYQFSATFIQNKSILISIPLLIQFAVGIIILKVAINWGHSDNE